MRDRDWLLKTRAWFGWHPLPPRTDSPEMNRFPPWLASLAAVGLGALGMGATTPTEEVYADFEGTDFGGWVARGDAFGKAPARGALSGQGSLGGYRGQGLACSFHGGDAATGTLTSPAFKVRRPFVSFLIGGGSHAGRTCVQIRVGDKVVRSLTGRDDEFLVTATFDLGPFVGQMAMIEIVDAATGAWGHINADHFVFSDHPATPPAGELRE